MLYPDSSLTETRLSMLPCQHREHIQLRLNTDSVWIPRQYCILLHSHAYCFRLRRFGGYAYGVKLHTSTSRCRWTKKNNHYSLTTRHQVSMSAHPISLVRFLENYMDKKFQASSVKLNKNVLNIAELIVGEYFRRLEPNSLLNTADCTHKVFRAHV